MGGRKNDGGRQNEELNTRKYGIRKMKGLLTVSDGKQQSRPQRNMGLVFSWRFIGATCFSIAKKVHKTGEN